MQDTTVTVPEDLLDRLRRLAAERETSVEALVREALEEKASGHRPKPRSLGIGASERTDIARRIGEEGFVPEPWR